MTIDKININSKPYQNVDDSNLEDNLSKELLNGYLNELNKKIGRFGVTKVGDNGTYKINDNAYWWESKENAVTVSEGRVFKYTDSSLNKTEITGATLETEQYVSFADNGDYLAMANGGKIVYTDGSTLTEVSDPDAPTSVTHIVFYQQYLLAINAGEGKLYWCVFETSPSSWNAIDFITAESSPDELRNLKIVKDVIYLIGQSTTEPTIGDGATPFIKMGTTIPYGTTAPNSVVVVKDKMFMLSEDRRMLQIQGATAKEISTPYDKTLQNMTTVSDCRGFYIKKDGKWFVVFNFYTENKTLVYDILVDAWYEWTWWDRVNNRQLAWLIYGYIYSPSWNMHIITDRRNHNLLEIDDSHTDDGIKIYFQTTTGNINRGTRNKKKCIGITLSLRRGVGVSSNLEKDPKLTISYSDNGGKIWSSEREYSLGKLGDYETTIKDKRFGTYRTRQWRIRCTDETAVELLDMEETYKVLKI